MSELDASARARGELALALTAAAARAGILPAFDPARWREQLDELRPILRIPSLLAPDGGFALDPQPEQAVALAAAPATAQPADEALAALHEALYEALRGQPRKRAAAFYTPAWLAEALAEESAAEPGPVWDPACGDGRLLLAAFEARRRLDPAASASELWGCEPDDLARALAEDRFTLRYGLRDPSDRPHIQGLDGLAAGAGPPGEVGLIIANPPYGLPHPRARELGLGSTDIYGPFVLLLRRLRAGGLARFIVSDTLLTLGSHEALRRALLEEARITAITQLPPESFDATVSTLRLDLVRWPGPKPATARVRFARAPEPGQREELREVSQATLGRLPGAAFSHARPSLLRFLEGASDEPFELRGRAFTRLSAVVEARVGIQTGDNGRFLRRHPESPGSEPAFDPAELLGLEDWSGFTERERRLGFEPSRFGGRRLVPFDKGGKSLTRSGELEEVWRPVAHAIDWSVEAVAEMRALKNPRSGRGRARLQNLDWGFRPALIASRVGHYSPTFRLSHGALFDSGCAALFCDELPLLALLGALMAPLSRYLLKTTLNHSVNSQARDLGALPLPAPEREAELATIADLVDALKRARQDGDEEAWAELRGRLEDVTAEVYALSRSERAEIRGWCRDRYPRWAPSSGSPRSLRSAR